jgi:hypothetical protein
MHKILVQFLEYLRKLTSSSNRPMSNYWRQTQPADGLQGHRPANQRQVQNPHTSRRKFTAEEVKRYLRGIDSGGGDRAALVMAQAGRISSLLDVSMRRHFAGRERIFDRLPFVVFQYTQGKPTFDIARSVSYFSDGDDVEAAMDFASQIIAKAVNRQR